MPSEKLDPAEAAFRALADPRVVSVADAVRLIAAAMVKPNAKLTVDYLAGETGLPAWHVKLVLGSEEASTMLRDAARSKVAGLVYRSLEVIGERLDDMKNSDLIQATKVLLGAEEAIARGAESRDGVSKKASAEEVLTRLAEMGKIRNASFQVLHEQEQ